jgi:uncharacterized protein YlxW (UPF0749 family)
MRGFISISAALLLACLCFSCSKDEKTSAERDKEIQKALQEGAQKEQKMYEGMQKGIDNIEKKMQDQKEQTKK